MNGALVPDDYWAGSLWATLAHSQGAVQLHHRLVAYVLAVVAVALGVGAWRSSYLGASRSCWAWRRRRDPGRRLAWASSP
jgi:cytochrome c oxidase assembly protein subunit 15